jgi:hypothetical protein
MEREREGRGPEGGGQKVCQTGEGRKCAKLVGGKGWRVKWEGMEVPVGRERWEDG